MQNPPNCAAWKPVWVGIQSITRLNNAVLRLLTTENVTNERIWLTAFVVCVPWR